MKIGILSMQRIKNYGSFLQAYALKNTIQSLGHEVEFVDYNVEKCIVSGENSAKKIKRSFFKRALGYIKRKFINIIFFYKIKEDKEKNLSQSYNEYLKLLDISDKYNYRSKIDTLVIGSDEVFNCLQINPDVGYSKELFGANNNADKVISYAASCGTTTVEGLKKYNIITEVGEMLSKFSAISVRDKNSGKVVSTLTNKTPVYNVDPVFIYNFDHLMSNKVDLDNYIIVYAYGHRISKSEGKEIKKFAKKYNKKVVCIGVHQKCCDIYIKANPFELLAYVKNADYIITDTFHGSVFSIKYNKQFATIIRDSNRQKLSDLLDRFSLSSRSVNNVEELENVLIESIDYTNVNKFINEQINNSIEYLKENI